MGLLKLLCPTPRDSDSLSQKWSSTTVVNKQITEEIQMLTRVGTTAMTVLSTMRGQKKGKERRGEKEQAFIEHQQVPGSLNIEAL